MCIYAKRTDRHRRTSLCYARYDAKCGAWQQAKVIESANRSVTTLKHHAMTDVKMPLGEARVWTCVYVRASTLVCIPTQTYSSN